MHSFILATFPKGGGTHDNLADFLPDYTHLNKVGNHLMVLMIILPHFPVVWCVLRVILPSQIYLDSDPGCPNLKL